MIHINLRKPLVLLALFSAYSVALLVLRITMAGNMTYTFLAWNLFLAWIPLAFARALNRMPAIGERKLLALGALGGWLLFFPNAPYILTDLFHLRPRVGSPYWLDLALLLSFALTGLLLGLASLREVHQYLSRKFKPTIGWLSVGVAVVAGSFGIYLGRYLRWNSWDVVRHPRALLADILDPLLHPFSHKETIAMVLVFSTFLFLGYLCMGMLLPNQEEEAR